MYLVLRRLHRRPRASLPSDPEFLSQDSRFRIYCGFKTPNSSGFVPDSRSGSFALCRTHAVPKIQRPTPAGPTTRLALNVHLIPSPACAGRQQNTYATTYRPARVRIPLSAALFAAAAAAFHHLQLFDVARAVLAEHAHLARPPALRPTAGVAARAAARGVPHGSPRAARVLSHVLLVGVLAARGCCRQERGRV